MYTYICMLAFQVNYLKPMVLKVVEGNVSDIVSCQNWGTAATGI